MKNLLFIGGAHETIFAMQKADVMDYGVYCTDINPESAGIKWAQQYGKGWAVVDVYDADQTTAVAKHWPLDGIIAVGVDAGVTVSLVATARGLPCIPVNISALGQDKWALKLRLGVHGIPVPREPRQMSPYIIVKPVDGRGGRGVSLVPNHSLQARSEALGLAESESPTQRAIVEEYIDGDQVSTESIIYNGKVLFTGLTDRDYQNIEETKPRIIEQGGWGPSKYEGTDGGEKIKKLIQRAVDCFNVKTGTIKGDIAFKGDTPYIIELAIGRLGGGMNASHYLPLSYGVDFLGAAFALACGENPEQYLKTKGKTKNTRGVYANANQATSHKKRGKFFLAIASTREGAERKADGHKFN